VAFVRLEAPLCNEWSISVDYLSSETTPPSQPAAPTRRAGLWRHADFMRLWSGQTISLFGSTITREAIPYTAILVLGATPFQMGLLGAAGLAPLLLVGLFAGVWVDRVRRRPLMLATDLLRSLLLLSIPLAYVLGGLSMAQLYIVMALAGVLNVLFDVANESLLPQLVERDQLVEGNSKLGVSASLAEILGPSAAGVLVQLISGPLTVLIDAISFVFSAFMLLRIRTVEPAPETPAERPQVLRDVRDGLRAVFGHPLLRALAITAAGRNFFGWFFGAIYGLYALEALGNSPALVGITVACGGIGALAGALLAEPITRRFGPGRVIVGGVLVSTAVGGLTWLAGGVPLLAMPLLMTAQIVGDGAATAAGINDVSLRQRVAPAQLLGRVNASMQVLGNGVGALGLLVGGALGGLIGLRATVAVAVLGGAAVWLYMLCSPLRGVSEE
jgi:Na+/melibiose symporter-like transporter